ncbi:MAG TPA: Crp/Fnr family transcriptional regulator [Prevotella sp.]
MQMNQLYNKLLMLPLFQGLSYSDLSAIVEQTPFEFKAYKPQDIIVCEDDPCNNMIFLIDGQMERIAQPDDRQYQLKEQLKAPNVLQPERIFGLVQRYTHTYMALTSCNALLLKKEHVIRLSASFDIFRINLLNILCTQNQRLQHRLWTKQPHSLRERVIRFFAERCQYPAGAKDFKIKMTQVAEAVNANRVNVSRVLNELHREELLILSRNHICIPALERLLM